MNTRAIAITIAFTALAVVLTPLRIHALYLPGFIYQIWEIPVVVAFLLMGPRVGVSITVLNTAFLFAVTPGPLRLLYPPLHLIACLSTLLGIHLAVKLVNRRYPQEKTLPGARLVLHFMALGILFRVAVMTIVDYALFRYVIFPNASETAIMAMVPLFAVFNVTLLLYTIPIGYVIARVASRNLKVGNKN